MKSSSLPKTPKGILLLRIIIPLLILFGALKVGQFLIQTKPKAKKRKAPPLSALVETSFFAPKNQIIEIEAMGTVVPSKKIDLTAQVSGQILKVSPQFKVGQILHKDSEVLQIDPKDFEIQVATKKAQVDKLEALLEIEQGKQEVAQKEWDLAQKTFGKGLSTQKNDWVLRKPNLKQAQADLKSAKLSLKKAELDFTRTQVKCPFNALVLGTQVDVGSQVTSQTKLGTLVSTDEYWVEILLPITQLKWIDFPDKNGEKGSLVKIYQSPNSPLQGHVLRITGSVESKGRMAKVLVSVPSPIKNNHSKIPLLLDSFVKVIIQGKTLKETFEVPQKALRDGEKVWINSKGKLLIENVKVIWKNEKFFYFKRENPDSLELVISNIPAPIPGLPLKKYEKDKAQKSQKQGDMKDD